MEQTLAAGGLEECYEELRAFAMGQPTRATVPRGLAVLLRQGTAGWVGLWSRYAQGPSFRLPNPGEGAPEFLPRTLREEVTMLVTEMALSARRR